jgi:hypothetical protein
LDSPHDRKPATNSTGAAKKIAFAALKHKDYRWFLSATMLAMMADNIEHVISYWVLFQKFQLSVLGGILLALNVVINESSGV